MTNPIRGFLFEAIKDGKTHGYLYAVEHAADKKMLRALENPKVKEVFDQSLHFYLENHTRFLNNINAISEKKGIEHYSENIRRIINNPEEFYQKIEQVPPPDVLLKRVLPGIDYHIVKDIYEKKGNEYENYLHSLEELNDDQQELDERTIQRFESNLKEFIKDNFVKEINISPENQEFHEKILKHLDNPENFEILVKVVKEKNKAWRKGDIEKYAAAMGKLDDFLTRINPEVIAFQRNREVNLARKVDLLLTSGSKNTYVFGVQHLVSSDPVNLRSLLEARGWTIRQI